MDRMRERVTLAVLCSAQLMLIVDVVALNVALPSIQSSLGIPPGQLQLAGVAYTLTFGSLLVVAGRAGDLLGRRRLFQVGLVVFTAASLTTAVAATGVWLFAGRALQGAGAALISPAALSMLTSTFTVGEGRNRALGVWAAVGSGGAIAGQVLGGLLTDVFGWRSIFVINLPVGIAALAAVRRLLPETFGRRGGLDLRGAALLTAGLAIFTLALVRVADHGVDAVVAGGALAATVVLVAFGLAERRHTAPLVKVDLLRSRGVRAGNGVLALLAGATAGALFFTTLYLQGSLGYSPFAVGLAFAPVTGIVLCVSPIAGRLAGRVGVRTLLMGGTACTAAGLVVLSRVAVDGSYLTHVLPGLAAVALGNGLAFAPTMIAATSGVGEDDQGLASGLIGTSQELGTAVGLAVVAPIAAAVTRSNGPGPAGGAAIAGYRAGLLVAAGLTAAAAVVAWRTPVGLGRTAPPVPSDPVTPAAPSDAVAPVEPFDTVAAAPPPRPPRDGRQPDVAPPAPCPSCPAPS